MTRNLASATLILAVGLAIAGILSILAGVDLSNSRGSSAREFATTSYFLGLVCLVASFWICGALWKKWRNVFKKAEEELSASNGTSTVSPGLATTGAIASLLLGFILLVASVALSGTSIGVFIFAMAIATITFGCYLISVVRKHWRSTAPATLATPEIDDTTPTNSAQRSDMPYPELLADEKLIDIVGKRGFSFSVTTFRVIMIRTEWGNVENQILQLDEIDSYATHRVSKKRWLLLAACFAIVSLGFTAYTGGKLTGGELGILLAPGLILSAICVALYFNSKRYEVKILSKRLELKHVVRRKEIKPFESFLMSVQKSVQEAKVRQ